MPPVDAATLAGRLLAAADPARRFIADPTARYALATLAAGPPTAQLAPFLGKSVLLATPRQLETAAALIGLDGVARRIVLWPRDESADSLHLVRAAADIDIVVTAWPLPAPAAASAPAPLSAEPRAHSTEWVLLTSGTTGNPKLVVHTLETLAGHLTPDPALTAGPTWATFYDISRYGGLQVLLRALACGGSLVLAAPDEPPEQFLRRAAAANVTHVLGTPTHWRRALLADAARLIAPTYVRLSGEVADQALLDRLRAAYPAARIVHAFASTEAGLAFEVTDTRAGFPAELTRATDAATRIRVADGTLRVSSPRNALGYLDQQITPIAGPDGFIDTGDCVERRADRLVFTGRRDGTVNVGGRKVRPEEVEAVINCHPSVQMCRVHARANPITGAIVVADIVCHPGTAAAAEARAVQDDIRRFCSTQLPPHKVPAAVRVVASLALTAAGKLARAHA